MKKIYKIIIVLIIAFGSVSCDDYLDVVPDNVPVVEHTFRNRVGAEKFLFTCYSYRPSIGDINADPAMNGGDETWQMYSFNSIPTITSSNIARGYQSSTLPILNVWDGENGSRSLWIGIRDCNIFLENIDNVVDFESGEKARMIAEVKFLKAYYHFYLLKSYGPIPITDVNIGVDAGPATVQVYRDPVDDVFNYVSNLMLEASEDLPWPEQMNMGTEAGRIDKLVALSMRAEVLLFAASPLFNGNTDYAPMVDNRGIALFPQTYDANKWKAAADACKEAIDACEAHGKELNTVVDPIVSNADSVFQLQTTYREAICGLWNKELIWGSTNTNIYTLAYYATPRIVRLSAYNINSVCGAWAPTLKMVGKYYSSNGVPIDEDKTWLSNNWFENRFKVRPEPAKAEEGMYVEEGEYTAYLHFNREPRFYASLGFDKGIYFGNGYYEFGEDNRNVQYCNFLNKQKSGYQGGAAYSITGYSAKKMHSFKNSLTESTASTQYFPFPILRLADLYLMYAEAQNEFAGPGTEVFTYLDRIRNRAGLKGVKESWQQFSTSPSKPDTKDGLREIIQNERTIELAFEGKRFWDIRRWKKISELNVQPTGWFILGETTEDFYKVIPVAKEPVAFTTKDYFWPIKESNLTINRNLLQNYGWQ